MKKIEVSVSSIIEPPNLFAAQATISNFGFNAKYVPILSRNATGPWLGTPQSLSESMLIEPKIP